jgi:acylglycerol lipase
VCAIAHDKALLCGHYLWAGEQFAKNGIAVHALDLRGRGKSEGDRYHVEKIEDYIDDFDTLLEMAKAKNPGLPVFCLATAPAA